MTTKIEDLAPGQDVTYTLTDGTPVRYPMTLEATLVSIHGDTATFNEAGSEPLEWTAQRRDGQWFVDDGYTAWQVVIVEAAPAPASTH